MTHAEQLTATFSHAGIEKVALAAAGKLLWSGAKMIPRAVGGAASGAKGVWNTARGTQSIYGAGLGGAIRNAPLPVQRMISGGLRAGSKAMSFTRNRMTTSNLARNADLMNQRIAALTARRNTLRTRQQSPAAALANAPMRRQVAQRGRVNNAVSSAQQQVQQAGAFPSVAQGQAQQTLAAAQARQAALRGRTQPPNATPGAPPPVSAPVPPPPGAAPKPGWWKGNPGIMGGNRLIRTFNTANMASGVGAVGMAVDRPRQLQNAGEMGAAQAIKDLQEMPAWKRLAMGWASPEVVARSIHEKNPRAAAYYYHLQNQKRSPNVWDKPWNGIKQFGQILAPPSL